LAKGGIVARLGDTYMVYWIDNTALEWVMGKKKDERKRRAREAEMHAAGSNGSGGHGGARHEDRKHEGRRHDGRKHDGGAPFAGIAATIARQMGTPVGRQMIAAGLMAAASAISKHDAKPSMRPTPPTPPTPPPHSHSPAAEAATSKNEPDATAEAGKSRGTGPFAGDTPEPPRSEANPLPPEFAKVLDSVAVGLDRLISGFGKPRHGPPDA
jgi:hypothetical protein